MVYLIIGILLLLLYVFATPQSIKGTVNIVILVFVVVALFDFADVVHLANLPLLTEFFVTPPCCLAYFSLRDITLMPVKRAEEDK